VGPVESRNNNLSACHVRTGESVVARPEFGKTRLAYAELRGGLSACSPQVRWSSPCSMARYVRLVRTRA